MKRYRVIDLLAGLTVDTYDTEDEAVAEMQRLHESGQLHVGEVRIVEVEVEEPRDDE